MFVVSWCTIPAIRWKDTLGSLEVLHFGPCISMCFIVELHWPTRSRLTLSLIDDCCSGRDRFQVHFGFCWMPHECVMVLLRLSLWQKHAVLSSVTRQERTPAPLLLSFDVVDGV